MKFLEKLKERLSKLKVRIKSYFDEMGKSQSIFSQLKKKFIRKKGEEKEGKGIKGIDQPKKDEETEVGSGEIVHGKHKPKEVVILPIEAIKPPKRSISPSSKIKKHEKIQDQTEIPSSDEVIVDSEPSPEEISEEEKEIIKNPKIKQDPLIILDLKDGIIKLQLPLLFFLDHQDFELASPISFKVEGKDIYNEPICETININEGNCIIGEIDVDPLIIELNLYKSVECTIESQIDGLNRNYNFTNEHNSMYIFQENRYANLLINDFSDFFKKDSYFWILFKNELKIEPSPLFFSDFVPYNNYRLGCIALNDQIDWIHISDSKNGVLKEIYQLPEVKLVPEENGVVRDELFDKEPIFSKLFKIIVENSDYFEKSPKLIYILNSIISGSENPEKFEKKIQWCDGNIYDISPELFDNRIGSYELNLYYCVDKDCTRKKFKKPMRKQFRYCPIAIKREENLLKPTSENYQSYPLKIQTVNNQEITILCDQTDFKINEGAEKKKKYEYSTNVPLNVDEIILEIGSENSINDIYIKLIIPRIKWRLTGVKEKTKFTGEKIEITYDEDLFEQNDIFLMVKSGSRKWIRDLALKFRNEIYSPRSYDRKTHIHTFLLNLYSERIERYLRSRDSIFFSLRCRGHEFPVIEIKRDKQTKVQKDFTNIKNPYIELNFTNDCLNLVIPEQIIKIDTPLKFISYEIEINGEAEVYNAELKEINYDFAKIEKFEILIKEPLQEFSIRYPEELEKYNLTKEYSHKTLGIFLFNMGKRNRARMEYLLDPQGKLVSIPKRNRLILHSDNFELTQITSIVEGIKIWDNYTAEYINLKEKDFLIIKNIEDGQEVRYPCEIDFYLTGNKLNMEDSRRRPPLFTGSSIEINSPTFNLSGWEILIKNRRTRLKQIDDNWTGEDPIILNCPDELGVECGVFELKIRTKEGSTLKTLKFRYMPKLKIYRTKTLITPKITGHDTEIIQVVLGENFEDWDLKHPPEVGHMVNENEDGFNLVLDGSVDSVTFSLMKSGQSETEIPLKITVPRLKWRLRNQRKMTGKMYKVEREKPIISGKELILIVNTNDINNDYIINAILKAGDDSINFPGINPYKKKGTIYLFKLNDFFNILRTNIEELILYLEIKDLYHKIDIPNINCILFPEIEEPIPEDIDTEELLKPEVDLEGVILEEGEEEEDSGEEEEEVEVFVLEPEEFQPDYEEVEPKEAELEQRVLVKLTHEIIRDTQEKERINYASQWIESEGKCTIKAKRLCIYRAAILSETLRNISFDDLYYEKISFNTQWDKTLKKPITGINISLKRSQTPEDLVDTSIPDDDIGLLIGKKKLFLYLNRLRKVLRKNGYCKIKARGGYLIKTASVCQIVVDEGKGRYKYDDIILYTDNLSGRNIAAIYIKISNPKFKKRQNNNKTKLGVKFQVGNSIFDL